jgi:hypothetical protein
LRTGSALAGVTVVEGCDASTGAIRTVDSAASGVDVGLSGSAACGALDIAMARGGLGGVGTLDRMLATPSADSANTVAAATSAEL